MCDSLTILRDGVLTANLKKENFSAEGIRQLMIGRELSGHYYREDSGENISDEIVLEMRGVTAGEVKNATLALHRGEILGIGGLSDCGMHTLGKAMFGLITPSSGEVLKDGKEKGISVISLSKFIETAALCAMICTNHIPRSFRRLVHHLLRRVHVSGFYRKHIVLIVERHFLLDIFFSIC